jgi:galactose mutarotase-like enzyme
VSRSEQEAPANPGARVQTGPVTLANHHLRLEIYPDLGAKIGSMILLQGNQEANQERNKKANHNGSHNTSHELLQQPLRPYARRDRTMAFEDGDASGYDECIPSVSACELIGLSDSAEPVAIPDHGDFWRLPFAVIEADDRHISMEATGYSLPLRFRKTVHLEGNRVSLEYRLTNTGDTAVHYLWSAHPAFAVDPGDRIELPKSVESVMVQASRYGRLGAQGTRHSWPLTTTASDDAVDLSVVGAVAELAGDGIAEKLFALSPGEGWCVLHRLGIGGRVEMRFDPRQAPYLGLWLCYGGWPEGKPARQYCVAVEPCTASADSLASAIGEGLGRKLAPHASHEWRVELLITTA